MHLHVGRLLAHCPRERRLRIPPCPLIHDLDPKHRLKGAAHASRTRTSHDVDVVGVPRVDCRHRRHRIRHGPIEENLLDEDLPDQGVCHADRPAPGIGVRFALAPRVGSCFDLGEKVLVRRSLGFSGHELIPTLHVVAGSTLVQALRHGEQLGTWQVELEQRSGGHGSGGRKQRARTCRGCIGVDLPPGSENGGQPRGLRLALQRVFKGGVGIQNRETDVEHAREVRSVRRGRKPVDFGKPLLDARPWCVPDQGVQGGIAGEVVFDPGDVGQRRRAGFENGWWGDLGRHRDRPGRPLVDRSRDIGADSKPGDHQHRTGRNQDETPSQSPGRCLSFARSPRHTPASWA